MTELRSQFIQSIEAELKTDNPDCASMIRRVSAVIEKEIDQCDDQQDREFIAHAQALMAKLHGSSFTITSQQTEDSHVQAKEKLAKKLRHRKFTSNVVKIASVAAALSLILFAGDLATRKEFIRGESSEDEQQYNFVGTKQEAGVVESGVADGEEEDDQIRTPHLAEAVSLLGFSPPMPTWYPVGWEVEEYYAYVGSFGSRFKVVATNENVSQIVTFEWTQYADVEYAQDGFEQSYQGEYRSVNGWNVYFSENIDYKIAIWTDDNISYWVGGPAAVNWEDIVKMIESIER